MNSPRRDRIGPRPASRLAWGLWLLVVLVEGLVVALLQSNDGFFTREWLAALAGWLPFLAFATVGAVILARRPSNRIGWLCWAIGFTLTLSAFGSNSMWTVLADQDRSSAWRCCPSLGPWPGWGRCWGYSLPDLAISHRSAGVRVAGDQSPGPSGWSSACI